MGKFTQMVMKGGELDPVAERKFEEECTAGPAGTALRSRIYKARKHTLCKISSVT